MAIHLTVGGSTAKRTLNCPGWIKRSEKYPKRKAGAAAIEGSMHHEVQEMCQRDGTEPKDHLGFVYKEEGVERELTEDDLDLSYIAFNATNQILDKYDIDELLIEPFVQLIPGEAGGSIDLLGLSEDRKTLLVLDYKFGANKVVAKENDQMLFYALCAETDPDTKDLFTDVEDIVLVIVQPKIKGTVNEWPCKRKTLDAFNPRVHKAIEEAYSDEPYINPGDHCMYCPAEPYCQEKKLAVFSATLLDTDSHNELCAAAVEVERVEEWVKSVKEELYRQLSRGVQVPGWKVVDKRAQRKWTDEAAVEKWLRKNKLKVGDIFKQDLKSPAQIEKLIKGLPDKVKGEFEDFVVSKSSGTTLATEDDSREAVVVTDVAPNLEKLVKSN